MVNSIQLKHRNLKRLKEQSRFSKTISEIQKHMCSNIVDVCLYLTEERKIVPKGNKERDPS